MAMSHMAEQVGRVLGGRYRLLAPLGSGMSAEVFLGEDVRLHRRVAIKLLHPALAGDQSFLRRFQAEARAAAALSHPNILAVYDWNGDAQPYVVMEYLEGGSLRSILDAGHRLSPSQALVVGLQAAQALDVAHGQGLVHRDMKPANLLFGRDGRVRIADFGLARATAEAALTEPSGAVLGTARYASPEQARGELLTGQSDVYALGLLLIEAVTGQIPFAAATTIATLSARLEQPIPVADELDALKPVLERVGCVDPAERLDAAGMVRGFMEAATALPRPAPLPLVVDTGFRPGGGEALDPTMVGPVVPQGPAGSDTAELPALGEGPLDAVPGGGLHSSDDELSGPVRPRHSAGKKGSPAWVMPTVLVAFALLVGAAGAWFLREASVPSHVVPESLVGAHISEVNALIGDRGWRITQTEVHDEESEAGQILGTDPEPGSELREGEELEMIVSLGPGLVELPPNLAGWHVDEARDRLEEREFEVDVEREPHDTVPPDHVIGVSDDTEEMMPRGATVVLLVSDGPETVTIPDVQGMTWDEAQEALVGEGLRPVQERERNRDVERGRVIRTEPEVGSEVEPGDEVTVVVSQERGRGGDDGDVRVPAVFGRRLEDAIEMIEDSGLEVGEIHGSGDRRARVMSQEPAGLTTVERGTEVDVWTR